MIEQLQKQFQDVAPKADFASLRFVREKNETISVRQDVVQPVSMSEDMGVMITVHDGGGTGYAATSDLSTGGLQRAGEQALAWAKRTAGKSVLDSRKIPNKPVNGEYETPVKKAWESVSLEEKIGFLKKECSRLKIDDRIVDWEAQLWNSDVETFLIGSNGGVLRQRFHMLVPDLRSTANNGNETINRTFGGFRLGRQGGLEILDDLDFFTSAPRVSSEAIELLDAPNCPTGKMDLILAPDQMILQIHESIGHPLELDRILGDERNYAGTSFVTKDMFGSYRYGSDLLNITFDPTKKEEMASYGFDDDGTPAKKEFIIREGILERPLGGTISQTRADMDGVANSRANSWNRPPIDRMANLNLEPGTTSFEDMVKSVE
ncbi:MAG: TldD/PmbA family protein, partial [Planctomycetota bacterium]|nr:TldD/PmbA family protein [Planctomycetota bacterium]